MLSTKPGDITKAQLEENLQKVEKYRKYIASTGNTIDCNKLLS